MSKLGPLPLKKSPDLDHTHTSPPQIGFLFIFLIVLIMFMLYYIYYISSFLLAFGPDRSPY